MTGISSYQSNGKYFYCSWVQGASDASASSGASGASCASGYYQELGYDRAVAEFEIANAEYRNKKFEIKSKIDYLNNEKENW